MKPYAESSEQNKIPIYEVLKHHFNNIDSVLEIGSGTGQHAVFFAKQFPHLSWVASDCDEYHAGIVMWIEEAALDNTQGPLILDVNQSDWPVIQTDAVFSANTVHIMSWPSVENMFAGIGRVLNKEGLFCLYGPYNYHGTFTSESNARFDQWLKQRDSESGIRDFEALQKVADKAGLKLIDDVEMPANNRLLVWTKI